MSHVETPLVKKLSTFVRLLPDELACLAELQSRRRTVTPLTDIVHEGQTDHRAWILQEGWANCLQAGSQRPASSIISFPLPGDFMGLRSVVLRTSDHSFASLTDAVIGQFALGDVEHHADGTSDRAAFVTDMGALLMHPAHLLRCAADDAVLDLVGVLSVRNRTGIGGFHCRPVVGVHMLEERFVRGAEFLGLQAEDAVRPRRTR